VDLNSLSSEESADEDEPSTDIASDTLTCTVPAPRPLPLAPRPQVGMKTPKSSFPQKKCINVYCKEEKQELKEEITELKAEIEELKSSSMKAPPRRDVVLTPSGQIDAVEASRRGLSEIADGVWCCPVRVKSIINSVSSRTALACAILNIFYPKEELAGKRLRDLNQKVIAAIAGKLKGETIKLES